MLLKNSKNVKGKQIMVFGKAVNFWILGAIGFIKSQ